MRDTYSAVRFRDGERRGWCGHKHRLFDRAVICARLLNRSWSDAYNETWAVITNGHVYR